MKIKFSYDRFTRTPRVEIGKFYIDLLCYWLDWFGKYAWEQNWQTFVLAHIEFEHEGCLYNWNGMLVLLGLGIRWHYQYKPFEESKQGKIITERMDEFMSGMGETISLEDLKKKMAEEDKE